MTATIPPPTSSEAEEARRRPADRRHARAHEGASPTGSMVNLLSPWVVQENRVHRLRRRFFTAAIGVVVVLPLVWVGLHLEIIRSQEELRGEQAIADGLQRQIADMGPLRSYSTSVRVRGELIGTTMASEVAFSRALTSLNSLLPDGVVLESIIATTVSPDQVTAAEATTACPGPDPFASKAMAGCVTLSGTAPTREAVSKLVMALGRSNLFVVPFVETTTTAATPTGTAIGTDATGATVTAEEVDQVTFSGSVGLSPRLLSSRYLDLLPDEPPAPTTSPSDTAPQDAP